MKDIKKTSKAAEICKKYEDTRKKAGPNKVTFTKAPVNKVEPNKVTFTKAPVHNKVEPNKVTFTKAPVNKVEPNKVTFTKAPVHNKVEPNKVTFTKAPVNKVEPNKVTFTKASVNKVEPNKVTFTKAPVHNKVEPNKVTFTKAPVNKVEPNKVTFTKAPVHNKVEPNKVTFTKAPVNKVEPNKVTFTKAPVHNKVESNKITSTKAPVHNKVEELVTAGRKKVEESSKIVTKAVDSKAGAPKIVASSSNRATDTTPKAKETPKIELREVEAPKAKDTASQVKSTTSKTKVDAKVDELNKTTIITEQKEKLSDINIPQTKHGTEYKVSVLKEVNNTAKPILNFTKPYAPTITGSRLHHAINSSVCKTEEVLEIIKFFPPAVHEVDIDGRTPFQSLVHIMNTRWQPTHYLEYQDIIGSYLIDAGADFHIQKNNSPVLKYLLQGGYYKTVVNILSQEVLDINTCRQMLESSMTCKNTLQLKGYVPHLKEKFIGAISQQMQTLDKKTNFTILKNLSLIIEELKASIKLGLEEANPCLTIFEDFLQHPATKEVLSDKEYNSFSEFMTVEHHELNSETHWHLEISGDVEISGNVAGYSIITF